VRGFLVDTNVLSEFSRRGAPDPRVKSWLSAAVPAPADLRQGQNAHVKIYWNPVTKAIGDRWAALSARAQEKGIQPSVIDGLVAATALEHDLTSVTRNVKDFEQLGVALFNPWES
jgi:predicted nucleic acid-binding protein